MCQAPERGTGQILGGVNHLCVLFVYLTDSYSYLRKYNALPPCLVVEHIQIKVIKLTKFGQTNQVPLACPTLTFHHRNRYKVVNTATLTHRLTVLSRSQCGLIDSTKSHHICRFSALENVN